jgi:hypothetical protein
MEVFARTFAAAASHAGLTQPAIARHFPLYRRCLAGTDPVLLVSRCLLPEQPWTGEHLLALTRSRLVVTHESRVLRRIRLHLDTAVTDLDNARWTADSAGCIVQLTVAAGDDLHRFQLRVRNARAQWQLEATLSYVFRVCVKPVPTAPIPIPNIAEVSALTRARPSWSGESAGA